MRLFRAAIYAGCSQMMPYYGRPVGTQFEEVGFGSNRHIITGLLREKLGFDGIICTDWGLITDAKVLGQDMPARARGAEHLTEIQRVKEVLDAGCDQFGGESRPDLVVQLVKDGQVPESRIDESVRRLLREKSTLGLFEQPFVDFEAALTVVDNAEFKTEGDQAQRRAYTLLTNGDDFLPLQSYEGKRAYVEGINSSLLSARGLQIVDSPSSADLALLRLKAPFEPRPGSFKPIFHAGSLVYSEQEKARQAEIYKSVPTVVDMYLDRPAVIPEIAAAVVALLVSYGSSSEAFLDVIFGHVQPEGKLPFDLPSSMEAVKPSRSDMQYDTANPRFRFGDELSYKN
jgi:beta-glucosidase